MLLQRHQISSAGSLINGGHRSIKASVRFRLVQPKFAVGNGLGGFDHPDPGLAAVDHDGATSELFAKRDLAAGTDLLHSLLVTVHAALTFMPSCQGYSFIQSDFNLPLFNSYE